MAWFYLIAGSCLGGAARYGVTGMVARLASTSFPLGTLIVNLSGCLLAGFFISLPAGRLPLSPEARLFLITGFCGAYTTFSAWMLESSALFRSGQTSLAVLNLALSLAAGYLFFKSGEWLARLI